MKLGQNQKWVIMDQKLGHRVKSQKHLVQALEARFLVQYSWNLVRMVVSTKSRTSLKMGHIRSRSLGHMIKKSHVYTLEAIFYVWYSWNLVNMFVSGQNVCLSEILNDLKNGSSLVRN